MQNYNLINDSLYDYCFLDTSIHSTTSLQATASVQHADPKVFSDHSVLSMHQSWLRRYLMPVSSPADMYLDFEKQRFGRMGLLFLLRMMILLEEEEVADVGFIGGMRVRFVLVELIMCSRCLLHSSCLHD